MTSTAEIADFVLETKFDDLSDEVIDEAKKRILDSVGIAIGAIGSEPVENLRNTIIELDQSGDVSIWGTDQTTSPPLAAALNGVMVRYLDFMDAFLVPDEVPHPSNNIAPLLSAAEYNDSSGKELITSIAIAYEIHYQLGKHAPLADRGWDHGTYVTITAAAGAAKLFKLDKVAIQNALGISTVGHNALRVTRTGKISMWKGMSASNAARNAIYSVILAKNGVEGPKDVFQGKKGWEEIVSGQFDVEYKKGDAVTNTMTKKYMAGTVAQTALDGLADLIERESIKPQEIKEMSVDTYKRAKIIMGGTGKKGEAGNRYKVSNREEADHSLPYTLAALALDGELSHEQYEIGRIQSDDVQNFMNRIQISEDPELTRRYENGEMPAIIQITLKDGTTFETSRQYFEGHPANLMTWERIATKFTTLTKEIYDVEQQNKIVEKSKNLDAGDSAELINIL